MKKFYFLPLLLLMASLSFGQTSDLYFSMYAEGSSHNKFLEIYNGTGADIDLDNYQISSCSNGCDTFGEFDYLDQITWGTGTTLTNGDVYVIAHPNADASILAEADMTLQFLSNGNDTYALTLAGATADTYTIIDIIGDLQGDIGSGWDVAGITNGTQNHTLTRKASICDPNPNELGSFGTDAATSEWVVGDEDSGWGELGSHTGCITDPVLTIASPADGAALPSGTNTVDIAIDVQNFDVGATDAGLDGHIHWSVNGTAQPMKYDTADEPFTVMDGETYEVYMELVDNSHTPLSPAVNHTITFSVEFSCDIQVGTEGDGTLTTVCDAETSGVDTYSVSIDFTGGGTSTYTIDTGGVGTVGGDDPSAVASGTITITDVDESTNFTVTFTGNPADSSCDFTRDITSPSCIGTVTCPNEGDVIITEIMQNPSAVNDADGEWFEVYNTTTSDINMQGWEVVDLTNGAENFTISNLTVPAEGYAILGVNDDTTTNGSVTVDYVYPGSHYLGNGADELSLQCSGTVIDEVSWDGGTEFPDPNGASMELATDAYNSTDNDTGSNWGEATTAYGDGDTGTPGSENDFTMSIDNVNATTFQLYPNPTSNGMVNIKSSTGEAIDVTVFNILGKQVKQQTVTETLNVSNLKAGVYILNLSQNGQTETKKLIIK